jgi:hypothetical protein
LVKQLFSGDQKMTVPDNEKSAKDGKIQIDRDLLNSTLNSWLMPGTTGNLVDSRLKNSREKKDKTPLVIYLGDGKKSGSE